MKLYKIKCDVRFGDGKCVAEVKHFLCSSEIGLRRVLHTAIQISVTDSMYVCDCMYVYSMGLTLYVLHMFSITGFLTSKGLALARSCPASLSPGFEIVKNEVGHPKETCTMIKTFSGTKSFGPILSGPYTGRSHPSPNHWHGSHSPSL